MTSVRYTLGASVENLTVSGTGSSYGSGYSARNVLRGTVGANVLTGLVGDDTYYVGAGDTVVEAAGGLK
jgi:hypothetical protein